MDDQEKKMRLVFIIITCLLIFEACSDRKDLETKTSTKQEISTKDTSSDQFEELWSICTQIDTHQTILDTIAAVHNRLSNNLPLVTLFLENNSIRLLRYPAFYETGDSLSMAQYYFDAKGTLIGYRLVGTQFQEQSSPLVIIVNSHTLLPNIGNEKTPKPFTREQGTNQDSIEATWVAYHMKNASDILQSFQGVSYTPSVDKKANLVLLNSQNLVLFKDTLMESGKIRTLNAGTKFRYLGSSNNIIQFEKRNWRMYKVITEDGTIGWVFGHPNFVYDPNEIVKPANASAED